MRVARNRVNKRKENPKGGRVTTLPGYTYSLRQMDF
jgi:hypothetical protein